MSPFSNAASLRDSSLKEIWPASAESGPRANSSSCKAASFNEISNCCLASISSPIADAYITEKKSANIDDVA